MSVEGFVLGCLVKRQIDYSSRVSSDEWLVCGGLVKRQIDFSSRGGLMKG
jgi:hypothetical protein